MGNKKTCKAGFITVNPSIEEWAEFKAQFDISKIDCNLYFQTYIIVLEANTDKPDRHLHIGFHLKPDYIEKDDQHIRKKLYDHFGIDTKKFSCPKVAAQMKWKPKDEDYPFQYCLKEYEKDDPNSTIIVQHNMTEEYFEKMFERSKKFEMHSVFCLSFSQYCDAIYKELEIFQRESTQLHNYQTTEHMVLFNLASKKIIFLGSLINKQSALRQTIYSFMLMNVALFDTIDGIEFIVPV